MKRKVISIVISIVVACSTMGTATYADDIQQELKTEYGENGIITEAGQESSDPTDQPDAGDGEKTDSQEQQKGPQNTSDVQEDPKPEDQTDAGSLEKTETSETKEGAGGSSEAEKICLDNSVDGITVSVSADDGVLPEDAALSVIRIDPEKVPDENNDQSNEEETQKVQDVLDEVETIRNEVHPDQNIAQTYLFDIQIRDADGNEIEPDTTKGKVSVSFQSVQVEDSNLQTEIYHASETGEETDVQLLDSELTDTDTVTAQTDGFSYYVVNFTYDQTTYTLNGDSRVDLDSILETVGLDGQCTDAVSSAPELFTAFSEDDKWYVQAVKAFSSTETLTVTLDNGGNQNRYEIIVTDDAVYSATITWSAGTITGTLKPQKYIWDAENTKYIPEDYKGGESRLAENASAEVSITVTNKSNASIYYTITQEDLSTDEYTLTHEASDLDLTEITKDSTGTGSVSAEYKDTVTLTDTTKTMATAATDVAEYVVDIQTGGIKLAGADTVAIGGTTTTLTASALVDCIGTPGTDGTLTWTSSDDSVMTVADARSHLHPEQNSAIKKPSQRHTHMVARLIQQARN